MSTLGSLGWLDSPAGNVWHERWRNATSWGRMTCAAVLLCAATATVSAGQTFKSLFSFDGADGAQPFDGLVQGANGNLYGTTYAGGAGFYKNDGTVFEIKPSGKLSTIYSFCPQYECTDRDHPAALLVLATNGNFYGTTRVGGANDSGTVFEITPAGKLTVLYSFCSQPGCTDGNDPLCGALVQATNGDFYGTTNSGGLGNSYCVSVGCGTVFKITPAGKLTTLYSFCQQANCADGAGPYSGLVQATDGNFYGTTAAFGANGEGTVFKITPTGKLTTLHSFCSGCPDGANPLAGLIQASDGDLYGSTASGGSNNGGTVFKITLGGTLTRLASLYGIGASPYAALIQATDGNFYGTTLYGGDGTGGVSGGVAFEMTPAGELTTLYNFCSHPDCTDGAEPYDALVQATNGKLYETTANYGVNFDGTVFALSVGLGPFVKANPTSGKVGAKVTILGNNLTGSTSVTFNGTEATFTVNPTGTAITTNVPSGATTGSVQVTTPSGTLTSNVPFRVTQ